MRWAAVLMAAGSLLFAAPAVAQSSASTAADPNALSTPPTQDKPPPGHALSAVQAIAIAGRVPKISAEERANPGSHAEASLKGTNRWQVSYFAKPSKDGVRGKEIAQVLIDDRSGKVLEAWTGFQVAWSMARGYPGAFGRKVNALYVWLPMCLLFLAPFISIRRPWRMVHLDLLVLVAGFSVSLAFFNAGKIGASVPLIYPVLIYLMARMIWLARRRESDRDNGSFPLNVPISWLFVGLVFLVGFRVGLNLTNSNVIDVGYSGVIGADRLIDGSSLYGNFPADNAHGDTYGPVAYYAYVPLEQAFPWSGKWDDLPAAHGAAVAFDLLAIAGLWLLGLRLRGPRLGAVLAYAWAACPITLLVANSNANDSLVAVFLIGALLLAARPVGRGAMVALAGMTKFAPLGLGPLFASHRRNPQEPLRITDFASYAVAFAVVVAVTMLPVILGDDGLSTFYDSTLRFQDDRGSPFSIWGIVGGLDGFQTAAKLAAGLFAIAAALIPRRRDVVGLAAMAAAVLIALQLGITHWFYLYAAWFLPFIFVVLFGRWSEGERDPVATP